MTEKNKDKPFESRILSVRELLGDIKSRYQIPKYQRPYKWEREQVEQLWEDLWYAYENGKSNYFLGAIITAHSGQNTPYKDVVDGQQRLTTLVIMCCIIRDFYPDINKKSKDGWAVTARDINDAISWKGESNNLRLRFSTHDSAKSDFYTFIAKPGATEEMQYNPSKKEMKQDTSRFKFQNSANILREKLKKSEKHVDKFINFLFNKVSCVEIECLNVNSAIKIFQVINGRGMNLATSDLIKSHLLSDIKDKNNEGQFVSDWQTIEHNVRDCEINMDDLLTIYQYYVLGRNPKKSLYDELMGVFEAAIKKNKSVSGLVQAPFPGDDPTSIVGKIKIFSEQFKEKLHEDNKVLNSFWYLPWSVHWKSVLLAALDKYDDDEYASLLETLRKFYYLHWIADKTLHRIKFPSFDAIKGISEGQSIDEIKKGLNAKLDKDTIKKAKENLRSSDMANEKWAKPLLLLIEYHITEGGKPTRIELDKRLHLEHVLPVEWKNAAGWKHFDKDVVNKYLHSAGNITLLSGSKNSAIKNIPFNEKVMAYQGENPNIKSTQGITPFEITKKICKEYNDNTYEKEWNEKAMCARQAWFLDQVETILGIKDKVKDK